MTFDEPHARGPILTTIDYMESAFVPDDETIATQLRALYAQAQENGEWPDPEQAGNLTLALLALAPRTLDGPESVIDALMDLMRVCDEEQEDFTDLLATAKVRYRAERYADQSTREMARLGDELGEEMRQALAATTDGEQEAHARSAFEIAYKLRRYTRFDLSPNFPDEARQIARDAYARFMKWNEGDDPTVTEGDPCPTCGAGAGDSCRLPVTQNCLHPAIERRAKR